MAGTFPSAWEEVAIVSIAKTGGTAYQFAAITETIDISEPDYPGEGIANMAGGRIWKQSAQEDGELTLEIYPLNLDTTGGVGLFQEFNGGTWDTSQPLANDVAWPVGINRARDTFSMAVMWTNDTSQTNAFATTTGTDFTALRFSAKLCRIISHKTSFTDGIVKTTVTLKFPDMNKAGSTKQWLWESTNDTDTSALPAITP
jgi:hypothetical protein|tara:strand:+ start:21438 stop:22040 length:603 start_codon:yes stop_codon:yes gene_type:complete